MRGAVLPLLVEEQPGEHDSQADRRAPRHIQKEAHGKAQRAEDEENGQHRKAPGAIGPLEVRFPLSQAKHAGNRERVEDPLHENVQVGQLVELARWTSRSASWTARLVS